MSRGGSAYARLLLGVPVRDPTGGFKCLRRPVLETLDLERVHANGYGFQIEITYRAVKAGFKLSEIPIVFRAAPRRVQDDAEDRPGGDVVAPALRFKARDEGRRPESPCPA